MGIENADEAVVLFNKIAVKSSPTGGQTKFTVNSGTKFDIIDELGTYYKVQAPDGSKGWIEKTKVEKITIQ
jgi:SH3-like domain-containing protein